jgi:hypothetical protein
MQPSWVQLLTRWSCRLPRGTQRELLRTRCFSSACQCSYVPPWSFSFIQSYYSSLEPQAGPPTLWRARAELEVWTDIEMLSDVGRCEAVLEEATEARFECSGRGRSNRQGRDYGYSRHIHTGVRRLPESVRFILVIASLRGAKVYACAMTLLVNLTDQLLRVSIASFAVNSASHTPRRRLPCFRLLTRVGGTFPLQMRPISTSPHLMVLTPTPTARCGGVGEEKRPFGL